MNDKKKNKLFYYLSKRVGRAIGDFGLIEKGDRILVAISGGKDSLGLIDFLLDKQRCSPIDFELVAYHVVTNTRNAEIVKSFLDNRNVAYKIDYDAMSNLNLKDSKKDKCFLCSWHRRKAIFFAAHNLNCNKIALGHNMDDLVQTLLMNMCFQSSISTMCPKQSFFAGEFDVIRPLVYLRDCELKRLARELDYPKVEECPWAKENSRKEVKDIILQMEQLNPNVNVVRNLFLSLFKINFDYIPRKIK